MVDLRGGTDAAMAPPVGYMQQILLPTLRRLFNIDITERVCDLLSCSTILHRYACEILGSCICSE